MDLTCPSVSHHKSLKARPDRQGRPFWTECNQIQEHNIMRKAQKFASSIFDLKYIDKMDCNQVVNKNFTIWNKQFSYYINVLPSETQLNISTKWYNYNISSWLGLHVSAVSRPSSGQYRTYDRSNKVYTQWDPIEFTLYFTSYTLCIGLMMADVRPKHVALVMNWYYNCITLLIY